MIYRLSHHLRFDEVSVKGDVNVHVVAVYGVLALPFVKAHPDLVALLQRQHHALTLHDGAVARLRVNDGLLALVLHDVQVRLLKVPRVDVHVEKVDARYVATVLAGEHVEVFGAVHEDGVENQSLVVVHAVEGLPAAHGESRMLGFASVTRSSGLSLGSFGTFNPPWSRGTLRPEFSRSSPFSTVTLVTLERIKKKQ